jgi:CRISPR-associated protein Csd1
MGYMQILNETFEKSRRYVGVKDQGGFILLPIAHSTQNAQIEIVLGLSGEWKSARKVEKAEAVTIIPVTEDSGSRSSGIAPHPLCDKLCYVAGDYETYSRKNKAGDFHPAYLEQLEQWVDTGCHEYVKAIYTYVRKGTMVKDLIGAEILFLDASGLLSEEIKIEGIVQPDVFIRFRIQDEGIMGLGEVWKEPALYDDYVNYYVKQFDKIDLDYISGQYIPSSEKQPSKIRNSGDKAKLISANDSSGFTYRGRFASKEEAVSVGYIPSQQAHNVLRWLIDRQGFKDQGMCVVTWNPEGEEVPEWLKKDSFDLAYEGKEMPPDLGEHYARELGEALRGRFSGFKDPSREIVVMSLKAATPGRLSVTYFQRMKGSEFLNHLIDWYNSCCWTMTYKKSGISKNCPMAPEPKDIVRAAYGVERNGLLHVDNELMEEILKRLIPCMVEGKNIPSDIVKAAFQNALRPLAYNNYNRRKILDITCALIRKKHQDRSVNKKGEYDSMSLDREHKGRDYLYGRLLAVFHKMEYDTFTDEEKGRRETNADRYRNMMVKEPQRAWDILDKKICSYRKKLKPKTQVFYQREMQEICDLFNVKEKLAPGKLGEEFLIAYNCELSELWKKKDNSKDE